MNIVLGGVLSIAMVAVPALAFVYAGHLVAYGILVAIAGAVAYALFLAGTRRVVPVGLQVALFFIGLLALVIALSILLNPA